MSSPECTEKLPLEEISIFSTLLLSISRFWRTPPRHVLWSSFPWRRFFFTSYCFQLTINQTHSQVNIYWFEKRKLFNWISTRMTQFFSLPVHHSQPMLFTSTHAAKAAGGKKAKEQAIWYEKDWKYDIRIVKFSHEFDWTTFQEARQNFEMGRMFQTWLREVDNGKFNRMPSFELIFIRRGRKGSEMTKEFQQLLNYCGSNISNFQHT